MRRRIDTAFYISENPTEEEYAYISPSADGNCHMLDADGWCMLHRECGEEGFTLENVLTDTESEERMLEKIALRQAIAELPEREKCVISLRYFHGLTQDRVAKVLGVSQVQVSRIEKKALGQLKELLL